jgi:hypothetical protein
MGQAKWALTECTGGCRDSDGDMSTRRPRWGCDGKPQQDGDATQSKDGDLDHKPGCDGNGWSDDHQDFGCGNPWQLWARHVWTEARQQAMGIALGTLGTEVFCYYTITNMRHV